MSLSQSFGLRGTAKAIELRRCQWFVRNLTNLNPRSEHLTAMMTDQRFLIVVRNEPGHWQAPVELRLRALLKRALRSWGLRAIEVRPLNQDAPQGNVDTGRAIVGDGAGLGSPDAKNSREQVAGVP